MPRPRIHWEQKEDDIVPISAKASIDTFWLALALLIIFFWGKVSLHDALVYYLTKMPP